MRLAILISSWLFYICYALSLHGWAAPKPAPLTLPTQTPMTTHQLDAEQVVVAYLPDGTLAYNVFEIAMQALQGRDAFAAYLNQSKMKQGLLPRLATTARGFRDPYQLAAYQWLGRHAVRFGADGLIWYYRFDNAYNDVSISAPWGSAFGQAHVIQAFRRAYREVGGAKYRDLSIKACRPFGVDIDEGGFQSRLPDGSVFFEEVPRRPATHILNGHMIASITLLETGKALGVPWIEALGQQGVVTLERHLWRYDTGYWSKYDMNPKKGEIIFRAMPRDRRSSASILLDRAKLIDPDGKAETDLDIGAGDDAEGAWRISGIEWGKTQQIEGRTARGLHYGPARHCGPVQGGSIQNTYLIFQLPQLAFDELSTVPTYFLQLDYYDAAPGSVDIEIQDISHGNFMGFRTLPHGTIYASGSQTWRSVFLPVTPRELGWFVGPDYQAYHIELLDKLHQLTEKAQFAEYASRWRTYLEMHQETNVEYALSVRTDCAAQPTR